MKIQKRVDKTKHVDIYMLFIDQSEYDAALKQMSPLEHSIVTGITEAEHISTMLKALTILARRIEDTFE